MIKKFLPFLVLIIGLLFIPQSGQADKISLKIGYASNSLQSGDINTWVNSYNSLWKDWQIQKGGQLTGGFEPLSYGPSYDLELRIPIFKGFAINLGGTFLQSAREGRITFVNPANQQEETQFMKNSVSAVPITIGFSLSIPLPVFPRLVFFAGGGRHIIFARYRIEESYEANFTFAGHAYKYWFNRSDKFRSEALGFYASGGIEFHVVPFLALVVEANRTWSKVDGFKGTHSFDNYLGQNESGKVSLYYYESSEFGLGAYYPVLEGHKVRPDTSDIRNIRQGQLNFSGLSIKIGIRFIF